MKPQRVTGTVVRIIRRSFDAVMRRIFDDAEDARYRDMQRDIERVIAQSGGPLSDEIERRIAERLTRNSSF